MTRDPFTRRSPDNPSMAERRDIERRARLTRLCRRDAPGVLDWPGLARRLADELGELAARLADDPHATAADQERVQRARAVVADYAVVASADANIEP